MRPCALALLIECLLLVTFSPAAPGVVKLTLVIPEGHKVTDVNLRFERQKSKPEGSFEGAAEEAEDEQDEGPLFDRKGSPSAGGGGVGKEAVAGRQSKVPGTGMVETFPAVAKKAGESHNTINKVIRLPAPNLATIRK